MLVFSSVLATVEKRIVLSHIECTEDNEVNLHFLVQGTEDDEVPGLMTITYSGSSTATVGPEKESGGVWHYNFYLPSGYFDVTGAQVSDIYYLHNPSSYTGNYACGDGDDESTPTPTETPNVKLTATGEPFTPTKTPTSTPTKTQTPTPTATLGVPTELKPDLEPVPTDGPTVPTWIWLPFVSNG